MGAAATLDLPLELRGLVDGDHSLILSSWLRNNVPDPQINRNIYFKRHEALIKRAFVERRSDFHLLVDPEDWIYGWICGDAQRRVLHFVYVKSTYRGLGLCGRLMRAAFGQARPEFHSHLGSKIGRLALKSMFDPYAFPGGTS